MNWQLNRLRNTNCTTWLVHMANPHVFKLFTSPSRTGHQAWLPSPMLLDVATPRAAFMNPPSSSLSGLRPRTGIVFNSNGSPQFWDISNIAGDTCCLFQGHILKGFLTRKQPNLNTVTLDLVRQKHRYWCIINVWSLSDMDRADPECFQKSICYLNYKHRRCTLTGWCSQNMGGS